MKAFFIALSLILASLIFIANPRAFSAEVTDKDEMWHNMGTKSRMAYEWFYFDIHNNDGSSLVVVFLGPNPYDVDKAAMFSPKGIKNNIGVLVQAVTADGKRIEVLNFTRNNNVSFTEKPFHLKMNNSQLDMIKLGNNLPEYEINLNAVDTKTGIAVKGHLTLTALMKGWKHKEGYVYSDGKANPKNFHKWFATVPKGIVNGSVAFSNANGSAMNELGFANASGYHDHNYGTLPISDTTDGWYWGRAEVNDKTIIYTKVFGKSKGAFLGDVTYKKNPASTMIMIATEDEVLVDSDTMVLEDYGPNNKTTLSNGMVVPKNYTMKVKGLNSENYRLEVVPAKPLAVSVPYYSRQGGTITLCETSADFQGCRNQEDSKTLISEQIDYPRYLQLVLGLPKPIHF